MVKQCNKNPKWMKLDLDWKGKFNDNVVNKDLPSDSEFKEFYETYLNQYSNETQEYDVNNVNSVSVPILDNLITQEEVCS